jgi:hypothetical protein
MHFHEAPVMYYDRRADRDNDGHYNEGKNYSEEKMNYSMHYNGSSGGNSSQSGGGRNNYSEEVRDYREGRSPRSRRMYMEAKE